METTNQYRLPQAGGFGLPYTRLLAAGGTDKDAFAKGYIQLQVDIKETGKAPSDFSVTNILYRIAVKEDEQCRDGGRK